METEHHPKLTASDISYLWETYRNDTMAICALKHFLANVEDFPTRKVLENALDISNRHVQKMTQIFQEEHYPLPQGFTEKDVNLDAPRLFSDVYVKNYNYLLNIISKQS